MDKFERIRAIAFDLDGTLIDTAPGLSQAVDLALYALELPAAGEERVTTWVGNGADTMMERALKWALKDKEPACAQRNMARKLFDRYYAETVKDGSFLFPGVEATLAALKAKGLPLAVVTNKPTPFVMPLLDDLGIAQYFRIIIGGDDVKEKKPHPEALFKVMTFLGVAEDELLFVGDSRNDIQAAQAAGCLSVGLTWGYNYGEAIEQSNPDLVFDRFDDLLPVLGRPTLANQEAEHE